MKKKDLIVDLVNHVEGSRIKAVYYARKLVSGYTIETDALLIKAKAPVLKNAIDMELRTNLTVGSFESIQHNSEQFIAKLDTLIGQIKEHVGIVKEAIKKLKYIESIKTN